MFDRRLGIQGCGRETLSESSADVSEDAVWKHVVVRTVQGVCENLTDVKIAGYFGSRLEMADSSGEGIVAALQVHRKCVMYANDMVAGHPACLHPHVSL